MIIDCHAHIASSKFLPPSFFKGWVETIKRMLCLASENHEKRIEELLMGMLDDPNCTKLNKEMNDSGIKKSVLLVIDFGVAFSNFPDLEEIHILCRDIVSQHPDKFIPFFGVDPRRGPWAVNLFERAVNNWGFKGLKLYPPCGFSPSDSNLFPYYEICGKKGIPVLIHIGPTSSVLSFKFSHPLEVDEAARLFPKVNFILAHAGIMHFREASLMAQYRPNIFLDISGFQNQIKNSIFIDAIKHHLSVGLSRRLLFGTDWPIHRFFMGQKKSVETVNEILNSAGATQDDKDNIFYKNYLSLLGDRVPC